MSLTPVAQGKLIMRLRVAFWEMENLGSICIYWRIYKLNFLNPSCRRYPLTLSFANSTKSISQTIWRASDPKPLIAPTQPRRQARRSHPCKSPACPQASRKRELGPGSQRPSPCRVASTQRLLERAGYSRPAGATARGELARSEASPDGERALSPSFQPARVTLLLLQQKTPGSRDGVKPIPGPGETAPGKGGGHQRAHGPRPLHQSGACKNDFISKIFRSTRKPRLVWRDSAWGVQIVPSVGVMVCCLGSRMATQIGASTKSRRRYEAACEGAYPLRRQVSEGIGVFDQGLS